MAGTVLDKSRTALLIADFYEAMMTTIPHAVDRDVVEQGRGAAEGGAGCGSDGLLLRDGVPSGIPGDWQPQQDLRTAEGRQASLRCSTRWP